MELHALHRHGWSIAALAREFGLNWRTARRSTRTKGAESSATLKCREQYRQMVSQASRRPG
jgi:hypothetical protein